MKKRLTAVLLAVVLVFSLMGCGGKSKGDSSDAENGTTTGSTEAGSTDVSDASDSGDLSDGNIADGSSSDENADSTSVEEVYGFHVDGTQLLDANGNPFVMRGVNHAHSWYADKDLIALQAIADAGSNCVRIVLANGIQWNEDSVATISALIEQCKKQKMICVLEVHDGTGDNSIDTLEEIAQYWIKVKDALIGQEAYVILNIANEWLGGSKSKTWRDGYTQVIPELRAAGIHNTIMVDSAGWGQYGKAAADYGQEVFDSDVEHNTMFSVHMYGTAGKNEKSIKKNLTGVTDQNLCVCVGEFGYTHSDGDVDEAFLMQYCQENAIGYLAWSWKGNGGGVEYLDLSADWEGQNLSPDWGEVVVNGANGIRETSVLCTVFDEE